jgi:hypothetical protein
MFLAGCPNPNIYGTPRTIPKGEVSHTVALEVYAVEEPTKLDDEEDAGSTWLIPTVPSYTLRWGLAERVDLGLRLSSAALLGVDTKVNFLRTDVLDLAIDPGVQGYYLGGDFWATYAHLPLLTGLNVTDSVTILVTAGYSGGWTTTDDDEDSTHHAMHFARLGAGLEIRRSNTFALQPEVTVLLSRTERPLWLIGWGLTFGPSAFDSAQDPDS